MMHKPYNIKLGHIADFKVEYRFYSDLEGGRKKLPFQGYRSDFWYENAEHQINSIFIVWPEFEDQNGNLILDVDSEIKEKGTARMWIISPETRLYHRDKIKIGTNGYFMEGRRKVAVCRVTEILGMLNNPTVQIQK